MISEICINKERILAGLLLEEIYEWEEGYKLKILQKYPQISVENLREKIVNAKARRFEEKHNKIIYIKIKRLKESL